MEPINQTGIFIVEDNNIFALALKKYIETTYVNMSLNIQTFETGEACMEKFREEKPQVVILDYYLNKINPDAEDGIKILDRIKNENKDTFVILLTSNDNIDIAIQSFKHGASDYVVKTGTEFSKISFSLLNFFKITEAVNNSIKYKRELNEYKENYQS